MKLPNGDRADLGTKLNAQALLQQIATLGLQLVEQMLIQRAMAAINAGAAASQAAVTGPLIAAAFAPAATAVTVATEGGATLAAPAEFAAALLAIQAMVVAHEGGPIEKRRRLHDGGLASDESLLVGQEGEIMIRRTVAQKHKSFLLALNAGAFHGGGEISPKRLHNGGTVSGNGLGMPQIHIYPVMDRSAIIKNMASREGQKLIFDVVKGHRIDLGIGS